MTYAIVDVSGKELEKVNGLLRDVRRYVNDYYTVEVDIVEVEGGDALTVDEAMYESDNP